MKKKAFIFDMDGVIIDSESWWDQLSESMAQNSLGQSIDSSYLAAKKADPKLTKKSFLNQLNALAQTIYTQAPLTPKIDILIKKLTEKGFCLAVVSGSMAGWIDLVMARLIQPVATVISVHDRRDLQVKPAPDGYLEAMKVLGVKPAETIILEDSNLGIKSAKAAGAFVICLTQLHPKGYRPKGADLYVKNIQELLTYLESVKL